MDQLTIFNYKLTIEYDGTNYCGFQIQRNSPPNSDRQKFKSIEGQLIQALKNFTQYEVDIKVAGRTDAGVHAYGQVINFTLPKLISSHQMIMGVNHYLRDEEISVVECAIVNQNFNARLDAKMRYYRYIILNRKGRVALDKNRLWHVGGKSLDIDAMIKASKFLLGKHDFSAFRDAECQAKSPIRSINNIAIRVIDEKIIIDISAKSFLHHMVRNIVGTLMWVGKNKISAEQVKDILASKDRKLSGPNAPACGLYFVKVDY